MMPKKILIVDDHEIIRQAIKLIVGSENDRLLIVGETGDGGEVLKLCRQHMPDLVLLDITLNTRDGLEVLKAIKKECWQIKVLIFSMHSESNYLVRALKAGADGYINKQAAPKQLLVAIDHVIMGKKYISPEYAQELITYIQTDQEEALHDKLSNREMQTLRLLGGGLTVSGVAEKLLLSVKTVSMYRTRILDKLDLNNTSELIRYAIEHHLVD